MKNLFIFFFTLIGMLITSKSIAQTTDSLSFENQRQRVNQLLEERSKRFGEYDQSLQSKTGIFGLFKSKNDMQASIDILKSIVINDNNIFIETRKLLDLKDGESERFERLAKDYDSQVTAYMKTISKLQAENENLRKDISSLNEKGSSNTNIFFILAIVFAGMIYYIFSLLRKLKAKN